MLSVLIPTYNCNVSKLVTAVHAQLNNSNFSFEIIVLEDGSTQNLNSSNGLSYTTIIENKNNIGRVKARQTLASKAKYKWLLFLDADVLPKTEQFITNYSNTIKLDFDAIFGGFAYYKTKPKDSIVLRWKYGSKKEQIPATTRNLSPYKVIISANYLIKKDVFNLINSKIEDNKGYGFDNYFAALLQDNNVKVLHIDNEVYHLGIEENKQSLKKQEQAALTLLHFYKTEDIKSHSNDLLLLFSKLNRYKLVWLFSLFFNIFKSSMKKNLLSGSPSITVLQIYRLSYMCNAYRKDTTV